MLDTALDRAKFADAKMKRAARKFSVRAFSGHSAYVDKMEHLRVAHVTDLHVGRVTPLRVQLAAAALVNAESPDLIAITGDFVCHSQKFLAQLREVIQAYQAPVVCVLGNHDHWSGASEVRRTLRSAGAIVLDNQNTTLTLRGQKLQIVGLDDAYTSNADVAAAVKGMRRDVPTLGLSHIAEEADKLWECGVPMVLSGHTHAGQITVARLNEISLGRVAGHRYLHGLYGDRRAMQHKGAVYVGAGVGASVMPLRLGERARREVAFFELGYPLGMFVEHHSEQAAMPGRPPSPQKRRRRKERVHSSV